MARNRKCQRCVFLPYHLARKGPSKSHRSDSKTRFIDVSSYADEPFLMFSPFYPHGQIPVPGQDGLFSDSVEGIWQGLKVIRGQTAPRYFSGWGKKRRGKPSGHQFGREKRLLKLEAARRRIYCVAYTWMLEHSLPQELIDELLNQAHRGVTQYFYDREDNSNLGKDLPLAHASVLVRWLNAQLPD